MPDPAIADALKILLGSVISLAVAILGFMADRYRTRSKNVERDAAIESRQRDLELKIKEVELQAKSEEAANAKAVRDSMFYNLKRNEELEAKVTTLTDQLSQAKEMIDELQDRVADRDKASKERDAELTTLHTKVTELQKHVTTLDADNQTLREQLQAKTQELDARDATISELNKQIRDLRQQINQLTERLAAIESHPNGDALKEVTKQGDAPETPNKPLDNVA